MFKRHAGSLTPEKSAKLGSILYRELGNGSYDGIPKSISDPATAQEQIKKIMKNLIYLWVIHHGETFSIISVGNCYYFVPTFLRKPLSQAPTTAALDDKQKQEWLAPLDVWNDSMVLSKQVTYRNPSETIISKWNTLPVDIPVWKELICETYGCTLKEAEDMKDHWNDISLEAYNVNYERTVKRDLLNLHWLMPQELPNALNI